MTDSVSGKNKARQVSRPVKQLILRSMAGFGRLFPKSGTPILIYHSIDDSASNISISAAEFEKQMDFLWREGYQAVPIERLAGDGRNGSSSRKNVAITFDDGYGSVHSTAQPILQKYGFTATVFLVTGFAGRQAGWSGADDGPKIPLLTWAQAGEMVEAGFEIQPHTRTHPHLTQISDDKARQEVADSRRDIEEKVGKTVRSFSYPYSDYNDGVVAILRDLGIEAAVTLDFGLSNLGDDRYRLKRLGSAHFADMVTFETCLYGRYDLVWKVKKNLKEWGL